MSWRLANDYEKNLLARMRLENPQIVELAGHLVLSPRIEPLLLRNARLEFTPHLQAEVESLLWFSPLIAARSNNEIILHHGIAAELAAGLKSDEQDELWRFTGEHTCHWTVEERLERDLRYYALRDRDTDIENGVGSILKRLHANLDEDESIELSRLAKRVLPIIAHDGQKTDETSVLARYAAIALGDANHWIEPGEPKTLPTSLAKKLPQPITASALLAEVHEDGDNGQVIHFTEAAESNSAIEFATPLPARLFIEPSGQAGRWHSVGHDKRIQIDPPASAFVLTTIEGRQWDLTAALYQSPEPQPVNDQQQPPLILSYFKADYGQVELIADWLDSQGIPFKLHEESPRTGYLQKPENDTPIVRVWSRNAEKYWQEQSSENPEYHPDGLFLRLDDVDLPRRESGRAAVLDWPGAESFASQQDEQKMQRDLRAWLEHPGQPATETPIIEVEVENDEVRDTALVWLNWAVGGEESMWPIREQLQAQGLQCIDRLELQQQKVSTDDSADEMLLKANAMFVIHHPDPRPLMKGDRRIDEADNAREHNIPLFHLSSEPATAANALYHSDETIWPLDDLSRITPEYLDYWVEVRGLLAEIENPDTRPEKRLEIGDRLDEIGDPRKGVGVIEIEIPVDDQLPPSQRIRFNELMSELKNLETETRRRLEIGDELDNMEGGDPRYGVGLDSGGLPEIDWVPSPAGTFVYGEDDEQKTLHLDAFEIARYPVTNAQYQAFVDDGGYGDERWWRGLKKPEFKESDWPRSNRPKINVDWFEATAFTRWLSYRQGLAITLPHETQWERAARGTSGLVYPWGNEYRPGHANVNEKGNKDGPDYLEQTNAVGIYPNDESSKSVQELAGNVWEWCSNNYEKPNEKLDIPDSPVLRGGAWDYGPDNARAAFRIRSNDPDFRLNDIGFRLLRSPPS